jgi:hypothetical protein
MSEPSDQNDLHQLADAETGARLGEWFPASAEYVAAVLAKPVDANGRSEWFWFRLGNGDLVLGVFPRGEGYFDVEGAVDRDYLRACEHPPYWNVDPDHHAAWKLEVTDGDTLLGYHEWAARDDSTTGLPEQVVATVRSVAEEAVHRVVDETPRPVEPLARHVSFADGVLYDQGPGCSISASLPNWTIEAEQTYTVSLTNSFDAQSPDDAARQFVEWATAHGGAARSGLRVEWGRTDDDDPPLHSTFIDAEDL